MDSKPKTYPCLPTKAWWTLRKKFHQTIPPRVTPVYLATVLDMQEKSAKANVLPGLKAVGLIEEDGATTARASQWRDDETYPDVCSEIREELYPAELRDAVPGPSIDDEAARRWFMHTTKTGQQAARKMVVMYSLLTKADPSGGEKAPAPRSKKPLPSESKGRSPTPAAPAGQETANEQHGLPDSVKGRRPPLSRVSDGIELPEMRLNLEIRIDASVTPEQIDLIFASMAKHLYRHGDERQ